MKVPFAWWWPALAATFTVVAITASQNYAVAVPAAAAAVIVAGFGVAEAVRRTAPSRVPFSAGTASPTSDVRHWLRAGQMGREDVVALLDRLERTSLNPTLPARSPEQLASIVGLSASGFYRYVAQRLADLEGPT